MRTRISPRFGSGLGKSVRYTTWSSPPCAAITSPRTRLSERYIQCQHRVATPPARSHKISTLISVRSGSISMLSIKVPPLGESIVEATVSRWLKKEGDGVAAGDTLVELETDKITVEVPALKAGVLTKQAKGEGDVVHVDDVLGELDETAVPATAGAATAASASSGAQAASSPAT